LAERKKKRGWGAAGGLLGFLALFGSKLKFLLPILKINSLHELKKGNTKLTRAHPLFKKGAGQRKKESPVSITQWIRRSPCIREILVS